MRVETPRARMERKVQNAVTIAEMHKQAMEAARAQEDGFLRLCWENYNAAMEQEVEPKAAPVIAAKPVKTVKKEQPENKLRKKMECFLSGMSVGAAVVPYRIRGEQ